MKKIIVTAIYDIKKYHPGINRWRSVEKYIKLVEYIISLNLETVIFTESQFVDKIISIIPWSPDGDKIKVIAIDIENLPIYQYIISRDETLSKAENLSGLKPPTNGQHVDKYFCSVINSKFYFIEEALKIFSNNNNKQTFIWMDSGIAHLGANEKFLEEIDYSIYEDKITNVLMKALPNTIDKKLYFRTSHGNIAASIIIFPENKIKWYNEKYYQLFNECIEYGIMPYEEQIMGIMVQENRQHFKYIFGDYGAVVKNLKYITVDMHVVIDNLEYCFNNNIYDTGIEIINSVISSISKAYNGIGQIDFMRFCYYSQVITFYNKSLGDDMSQYFALMLSFMYNTNDVGNKWVTEKINIIERNLNYVNVSLYDKIDEEKILNKDKYNILWRVI